VSAQITGLAYDHAYPASEPPTQAMVAGVNAGAFPALVLAGAPDKGVGEGLFRMAKQGTKGRSVA
jgi:hypothetical protein